MIETMEQTETVRAIEEPNLSNAERWISTAGGAALIGIGMADLQAGGIALAAGGGYLLYRGVTGRCAVYRALGISSKAPARMRMHAETTTYIYRPVQEVFAFFRDPENFPRATRYLRSVARTGEDRMRWRFQSPGGKIADMTAKLEDERPLELLRWRFELREHSFAEARFASIDGGRATEVRVSCSWPGRVLVRGLLTRGSELAASMMLKALLKGEVARIKAHLEAAAPRGERAEGVEETPVVH